MFGFGSGPTGPDETTMASLDDALTRPICAAPSQRRVLHTERFRRGLAAAYRAGTIDVMEAPISSGPMPLVASLWPAADLTLKARYSPDHREFFVVFVQVREEDGMPFVLVSAFRHDLSGCWEAMDQQVVGLGGCAFAVPATNLTVGTLAVFAVKRELVLASARLVSERHQALNGIAPMTRH
jgi:hypothetical protein